MLKKILFVSIILLIFFASKSYAANKIIVLDPGHGGDDSGAVNKKAGIYERDINLKIATYLKEYLEEYAGVTVVMTHTGFKEGTMDLLSRAMVARDLKADMLISLHCNSTDSSTIATGAEAYVTHNTSLPKYNEQCSKLASLMLNNLNKLGINNRGVKTKLSGNQEEFYSDGTRSDYYGIIRCAMKGVSEGDGANVQNGEGIPVVLLEHCFIQNGDEKYISSDEAIQKLSRADCDAIVEFFNLHIKDKAVSAITLDKENEILALNDTLELKETIYPEWAEDKTVIWTSSDEKVATVENGIVTGKSEGTAQITATTNDGGYTATCKILVKILEIQTNIDEINCLVNENIEFDYKVVPTPKEDVELTIEIEDEEIAVFNEEGMINIKAEGETNIIIKYGEILEKKVPIKVNSLLEDESIVIKNLKQEHNKLTKIEANTLPEDFLKNFEISDNLEIILEFPNEIKDGEEQYITTNTKVKIIRKEDGKLIKTYICKIYGDVNEDGKITASDYGFIKNYIIKRGLVDVKVLDVTDVSRDGNITATDYGLIKNYIMKGTKLEIE